MKVLLLTIFLFTNFVQATEILVYSSKIAPKLNKHGLQTTEVFTAKEKILLKGTSVNTDIIKIKTNRPSSDIQLIKSLCNDCKVEINHIGTSQSLPKDQYYKFQWALNNDGTSLETWTSDIDSYLTQGVLGEDLQLDHRENNSKVLVAIIDSGLDINHPDLQGQIYTNEKECKSLEEYNNCLFTNSNKEICYEQYATVDHNNNDYPLDCHGWNISGKSNPKTNLEGNGNISDSIGHGTHVAGIIGAKKNKIGIAGVISNVELLPIQVSIASQNNSNGELATDKFAKALLYAIKSKAQIINMSLGWRFEQDSILMRQMIELALQEGILIVAAGGNDHHAAATYPCSYEEVICVGSHSVNGKLSSFSNFGSHIDLLAPGNNILSTWPTNKRSRSFTIDDDYEYMSGTSQAAPFVTGVLARLINSGISSTQAKIKLLQGTRKKRVQQKNFIRHGNLDYLKSLKTDTESFIYPLNKSAALINWSKEEKTFKLKLKNYAKQAKQVEVSIEHIHKSSQPLIKLSQSKFKFQKININEIKELQVRFKSQENVDGNFLFKIKIKSNDENKNYFFQAKAISVISAETERVDLERKPILGNTDFLKSANLRPFTNTEDHFKTDYLAFKEIDGKTFVARVRETNSEFVVSEDVQLPFKSPIIINLSKVDLDLDGKSDYVITAVNFINKDDRDTKFLAFDENFKLKRILISPQNTFINDLTVLPGSFKWIKYNNAMVPTWITMGERPQNEREAPTPWNDTPIEIKQNRLYIQLKDGLKTISFPGDEEIPLHFLYQSNLSKSEGHSIVITSSGFGYFKTYRAYRLSDRLEFIGQLNLDRFFDLASAKPLPMVNQTEKNDNAFFSTVSINGDQNILAIKYDPLLKKIIIDQMKAKSQSAKKPIRFVLSYENGNTISQTNNELVWQGDQLTSTPSKTDARRIKHQLLQKSMSLFLPSDLSPGLGSEIITAWDETSLYRPAAYQTLGVKSCSEVRMIYEDNKDKLIYYCSEENKILKINIIKLK